MADSQKQVVQWFPGHMAKTRRLIKESLSMVDCVTEILDARIPLASRNPEIEEITSSKPRIILLNKCDMADEKVTADWIRYFKARGSEAIAVDCRSGKGLNAYQPLVRKVLADKIKANNDKGMVGKSLRVMVVGIPNTGKSSFINKKTHPNKRMSIYPWYHLNSYQKDMHLVCFNANLAIYPNYFQINTSEVICII